MENQIEILQLLHDIRKEIDELKANQKEVLNFEEACRFLSVSASHLYKLTSSKQVPCYQPNGKKLYFKRSELDTWLLRSKKITSSEIDKLAVDYIQAIGHRKGGRL